MNKRAAYEIVRVRGEFVFLVDLSAKHGGVTITNDAEGVTADVALSHPGKRIIYRDTDGQWDELLHTDGVFKGYGPAREIGAAEFGGETAP